MVTWHREEALTFDDVLIRPAYSTLPSRLATDTKIDLFHGTRSWNVQPIIVANMIDLTTPQMVETMYYEGIIVPVHRNQAVEGQLEALQFILSKKDRMVPAAASIGLNDRERAQELVKNGVDMLFLELAHAHTEQAIDEIKWIKKTFQDTYLVVGNIATKEAIEDIYSRSGSCWIKCGIGPGAVCSTRIVTGCGVPQLSAIIECSSISTTVIADGGIRQSGDIVKALAAGARMVMIGSLFAGTDEANIEQIYSGMASREAGGVRDGLVPEGISVSVPYKGSAKKVARDLIAGLRQGMAMVGAKNLTELREKTVFQRVSQATIVENGPHILLRK